MIVLNLYLKINLFDAFCLNRYNSNKSFTRSHDQSMKKLKELLSDDLKVIRHRRLALTLQITSLSWLVEFLATFVGILVRLIGVDNNMGLFIMKELVHFLYEIVLPGIVVIRDSELKDKILESALYISILEKIGWTYKGPLRGSIPNDKNQPSDSPTPEDRESNNIENNESLQDLESQSVEKLGSNYKGAPNGFNVNKTGEGHSRKEARLRKQPLHSNDCEIFTLETKELKKIDIENL